MNARTFWRMMEQMIDEEIHKLPEDVREDILAEIVEDTENTLLTFDLCNILYPYEEELE